MTVNELYLGVLNGKKAMVNDWNGLWLIDDGEFICVRGAGEWAHRTEDKEAFVSDVEKFVERYGNGDINNFKLT